MGDYNLVSEHESENKINGYGSTTLFKVRARDLYDDLKWRMLTANKKTSPRKNDILVIPEIRVILACQTVFHIMRLYKDETFILQVDDKTGYVNAWIDNESGAVKNKMRFKIVKDIFSFRNSQTRDIHNGRIWFTHIVALNECTNLQKRASVPGIVHVVSPHAYEVETTETTETTETAVIATEEETATETAVIAEVKKPVNKKATRKRRKPAKKRIVKKSRFDRLLDWIDHKLANVEKRLAV